MSRTEASRPTLSPRLSTSFPKTHQSGRSSSVAHQRDFLHAELDPLSIEVKGFVRVGLRPEYAPGLGALASE